MHHTEDTTTTTEASEELYRASGLRSWRSASKALRLAAEDGHTEADLLADRALLARYAGRVRTGW